MVSTAGDFVTDEVWHRVVQIITNQEELQKYAVEKMYGVLAAATAHETSVKIGAYVLGEFGFLLNDDDAALGGSIVSGAQQFEALHQHFPKASSPTKCMCLSTYAKMLNLYPELRERILPVFVQYTTSLDAELQQRAVEYNALPSQDESVGSAVLDSMPPFPERESVLEVQLRRRMAAQGGEDAWGDEGKPKPAEGAAEAAVEGGGGGGGLDDESPPMKPAPAPAAPAEEDLLGFGAAAPAAPAAPAVAVCVRGHARVPGAGVAHAGACRRRRSGSTLSCCQR